jgi:hypothetical protein
VLQAQESIDVSEDIADEPDLDGDLPPRDVALAMRFAEMYPAVPLRTLFIELRHADVAVPVGADDRSEIITRLVHARLGAYGARG